MHFSIDIICTKDIMAIPQKIKFYTIHKYRKEYANSEHNFYASSHNIDLTT